MPVRLGSPDGHGLCKAVLRDVLSPFTPPFSFNIIKSPFLVFLWIKVA